MDNEPFGPILGRIRKVTAYPYPLHFLFYPGFILQGPFCSDFHPENMELLDSFRQNDIALGCGPSKLDRFLIFLREIPFFEIRS